MNNEIRVHNSLHTLIPFEDFKAILGTDDREDALSRYCLITATHAIEQYCKRRLLRAKRSEFLPFYGDYIFPLRDYPVREVELCCAQLYAAYQTHALKEAIIVEPGSYHTIPGCGELEDIPFCLSVSPALRLVRELSGLKVHYRAGYVPGKAPPDLASACLELAAGPNAFVLIWEFTWPHAVLHFWANTLIGSRALSGVEHEPLPGASPAKRVLDWHDRECPGERERRGASGNVHAGERAGAFRTVPAKDRIGMTDMTDKEGLLTEEKLLNSFKKLLSGRVNELLGETEYPMPPIEFV
ncbi:MAG: hypothetical protein LBH15_05680 [Treponema sp.]|jgi:hypothetical protein|nr:hypothetical protein [Treponema sp.]